MRTHGDKASLASRSRATAKFGTPIAPDSTVTQQDLALDFSSIHPIDTLLVHQLETLLQGEQALQERYATIDPSSNSVEVRMAFSKELAELTDRADRLYRLVNAIDNYGPCYPKDLAGSYAAA